MFNLPFNLRKVAELSHSSDISELMEEFKDRHSKKSPSPNGQLGVGQDQISATAERSAKPIDRAPKKGRSRATQAH